MVEHRNGICDAIRVAPTATNTLILMIGDPAGNGGHRLSGHCAIPTGNRRKDGRNGRRAAEYLSDRADQLRRIVGSYCDETGKIVSPRSFRAAFRLDRVSDTEARTVVRSKDRSESCVLETHRFGAGYDSVVDDIHRRLVAVFTAWA